MADRPARVLVDLSHAAAGYVGIAQDIRLVFSMLCDLSDGVDPEIDVAGLLMPTARHDLPPLKPGDPAATAAVLHWMARNWRHADAAGLPARALRLAAESRAQLRSSHPLVRLTDPGQADALWRILFAATLPPAERPKILARPFYATDLAVARIIDRTIRFPRLGNHRLAAEGFDAVLFCMPRPVVLPPGVRPIMRFHDAVPVTDTDTVADWRMGAAHQALVRACPPDTIFACDSPQARDALLQLDPSRARLAAVVPCAIAPPITPPDALAALTSAAIIIRHLNFRALGDASQTAPPGWQPPEPDPAYVIAVSTIEPRKNYPALLRAFERLRARDNPGLRLVIVGGLGWRDAEVMAAMRPGVASGAILHLSNVPPEELQLLLARARCLVSPSFNEGFGLPPLEALQAGCPVVLSDLPVYRWIFGDHALYADPYDVEALARQIARLAGAAPELGLREMLLAQQDQTLQRFRPEVVRSTWKTLIGIAN